MTEINCVDLVIPLVQELDARGVQYQIMGGIGSAALTGRFIALPEEQVIETSKEVRLSQYRENKSLRDVDVLVLSNDDAELQKVEAIADDVIGEELILSIFGLKSVWDLRKQKDHPGRSFSSVFLADRYVGLHGVGECYKALYPFISPLDPEALETWYVPVTRGAQTTAIPIPHPGASILNYVTRSVSGIRPKDEEKLRRITASVACNFPEIKEWIHDGPGKDQLAFAGIVHSLRQPKQGTTQNLQVGEIIDQPAVDLASVVADSKYSMISELPIPLQRIILAGTRTKAHLIHWGESNEQIVRMFQDVFEKKLDRIVKNK